MINVVVIGVPVAPDHQADTRTVTVIEAWTRDSNVTSRYEPSPSPEEGRDKIVSYVNYLIPRPTHILFLDSDVLPRANTLRSLMSHDKDIISGVVPICQQGVFKWNVYKDDAPIEVLPSNPFKIDACGFGAVLVKTSALDKMKWPYWRSIYKPGLRTIGEDIYFCQNAKRSGLDIWCDPKVKCDHATRSRYLSIMKNLKGKTQ